jgi:hypothetical protein
VHGPARLREQVTLAEALRADGRAWPEIGAALRHRYGLNARVAMRVAHGWTQADTAREWNRRWPDDPKTFKNISYWENWPSPTGHMPSLLVLDRLAELYECDAADLLAGWGEHGGEQGPRGGAEADALAWQVDHLDLRELARAIGAWARRLPAEQRRALLLKLSSAAAVAAGRSSSTPPRALGRARRRRNSPGRGTAATPTSARDAARSSRGRTASSCTPSAGASSDGASPRPPARSSWISPPTVCSSPAAGPSAPRPTATTAARCTTASCSSCWIPPVAR